MTTTDTALIIRSFIETRTKIDTTWRWRDRHGERHAPEHMATTHVFHTLKMIWNNTVPSSYHVGYNVRLYSFGPSYTKDYMIQAVYQLGHELTKRALTNEQTQILRQMHSYFTSMRILICSP